MTATVIPHDFGRRDPAPDDKPGEFPKVLQRDHFPPAGNCRHDRGPFTLLEAEGMAECHCGERVTLVHLFKVLAGDENRMRQRFEYQRALVAELESRTKIKCDHCGKFTQLKK